MTHSFAEGERFITVSGDCISVVDIAGMLKAHLGGSAKRVPRLQLPDWLAHLAAKRDPSMQQLLPLLCTIRNATSEKDARLVSALE
jgi:dihydroflavonol-4-reductase